MGRTWHDLTSRVAERLHGVTVRNPSRPRDREAAVLLLLLEGPAGPSFLGIVRASHGTHGGQFGLPGGRREPGEALWDCALREAREEVSLDAPVRKLGDLGEFNTAASGHRVQVMVGATAEVGSLRRDPREVDGICIVPFSELLDDHVTLPSVEDVWHLPIELGYEFEADRFLVDGTVPPRGDGHRLARGERRDEMPFVWGLTARILYVFLSRVWLPSTKTP